MATKTPSLLIPNFKDRQLEVFAKSLKAFADHVNANMATTANTASSINVATLQSEVATIQSEITEILAELAAITSVTYTATQAITVGQVVYEPNYGFAAVADNTAVATSNPIIGIATSSAPAGGSVTVAGYGLSYTSTSLSLVTGPVFLGPTGTILTAPPVSPAFVVRVGYAVSTNTIFVSPQPSKQYSTDNLETISTETDRGYEALSPWLQMPTLNTIDSGLSLTVPDSSNFLVANQTGLVLNGSIIVDGTVVMV